MEKQIDHKSRSHSFYSASASSRWLNCTGSAVAAEAYPAQDTEFTREGTLAHEVAEAVARTYLEGEPSIAKPDVTKEMVDCAQSYGEYILEHIEGDDATVLLEQRVDYSPWAPGGFGTADCIILQGSVMDVIDYKYGQGVPVSAEANTQEMLYGLGALNDYGIAYDIETVRLHIYQPRINNVSVWEVKANELLSWGNTIVKPLTTKVENGEVEYFAGEHCRFCPHAGNCPTLAESCMRIVEWEGGRAKVPFLAEWQVADILAHEAQINVWLKAVKAQALNTLLDGGTVPGYKVVEGRPGNRKWTDELKVAQVLDAAGYGRGEYTETKLLSPASLEKVLGRKQTAELLDGLIDRAPGTPIIVAESDKRPAYDRGADFAALD